MVKPHCPVCLVEMRREDLVVMSTMYDFQHEGCFNYKDVYIKDHGTFEELVAKYPEYTKGFLPV